MSRSHCAKRQAPYRLDLLQCPRNCVCLLAMHLLREDRYQKPHGRERSVLSSTACGTVSYQDWREVDRPCTRCASALHRGRSLQVSAHGPWSETFVAASSASLEVALEISEEIDADGIVKDSSFPLQMRWCLDRAHRARGGRASFYGSD